MPDLDTSMLCTILLFDAHYSVLILFFQVKMLLCPVKLDQYLLPKFSGIVMALKS